MYLQMGMCGYMEDTKGKGREGGREVIRSTIVTVSE